MKRMYMYSHHTRATKRRLLHHRHSCDSHHAVRTCIGFRLYKILLTCERLNWTDFAFSSEKNQGRESAGTGLIRKQKIALLPVH